MQEFLFENPIALAVVGLVMVAVSAFVWTQTGRKSALYATAGLVVLTIVLLLINLQVVTDRETIRHILHEAASAVEANDHDKVYGYIHPNAFDGLRRAKRELPRYKFREARVTGVKEIAVNDATTPPTAIAECFARVKATRSTYEGTTVRFVRIFFMQHDGKWLVRDYEHDDPAAGFRDNTLTQPGL